MATGTVFLIPTVLDENGLASIPAYVLDAVKQCQVFFVENERTARRFLKSWWKEMIIDDYQWFTIHKAEAEVVQAFTEKLAGGFNIGIISEAGCPGVADPGQLLIAAAQRMNAVVKPLVGPSSILLALMASGMNGQQFRFTGYLPIDNQQRTKTIRDLEADSRKNNCTQIFIETPYRNNQLLETLLKTAGDTTLLCIAVDLTGEKEWVRTKTIAEWKKEKTEIHKRPAIFLMFVP
ncbi:MAG: SAM-dependent methyltransferase [Chitinophagaceae bacterium]|nr:MAG: SAM-dependent methyltransferase [Chitinophagaceae bacterium]